VTLDPSPVATATRLSLRIELRETEDEDVDRDRLERVLEALREFPGGDEVRVTVRTLGGGAQRVVLPSARACDDLTARLTAILADAGAAEVGDG
jgi:glutamine synthetase adenylyltransferase